MSLTETTTTISGDDELSILARVAEEFFSSSLTAVVDVPATSSASTTSSASAVVDLTTAAAAASAEPVSLLDLAEPVSTAVTSTIASSRRKKKKGTTYLGDVEEPFMVTDDVREHLIMAFEDLMKQFVEASSEVWPRCPVLNRWKTEFLTGSTDVPDTVPEPFRLAYSRRHFIHQLVLKFHGCMNDFYGAISEGNPQIIFDSMESESEETIRMVQPLIDLKVRDKYESAHSSVQETVMMYMQQLCQFSNMYVLCNKFPDNAMQSIFAMSRGLESKLKKGEMNLSDFNLSSLRDIGKSIVEGMNESSVDRLTRALTSDGGLENMVMMMGSMVKNMSGGAVDASGISEMLKGSSDDK
jgi:hypothetical protein